MALFGRGKGIDADELQAQLKDKQEALLKQLQEMDPRQDGGGGGRFFLGLLVGGALGAAALYFFDAEKGEERRQSVIGGVETELFRDASIPKGQISINTVDGVVYLRGTANSQEQIDTVERRIKGIEGVEAVINLLRLPATAR
jgi:gas vesicle protein